MPSPPITCLLDWNPRLKSQNRVEEPIFSIPTLKPMFDDESPHGFIDFHPPHRSKSIDIGFQRLMFRFSMLVNCLIFGGGGGPPPLKDQRSHQKPNTNFAWIQGTPFNICFPPSSKWIAVKLDIWDTCQIPFVVPPNLPQCLLFVSTCLLLFSSIIWICCLYDNPQLIFVNNIQPNVKMHHSPWTMPLSPPPINEIPNLLIPQINPWIYFSMQGSLFLPVSSYFSGL